MPLITLTEKATQEIQKLKAEENDPNAALRVQVVGGGCSGMSYKLSFESATPAETDAIAEFQSIKIYIDQKSALYLSGMELDFSGGLNGTGFIFNNPNAKRTCGCGTSFSA